MVVTSEPQSRASRSPSELEAALGAVAADDVPEADGRDVAAAAARVKAVLKEQRLTLQVRAATMAATLLLPLLLLVAASSYLLLLTTTMLLRCCHLCYCSSRHGILLTPLLPTH